MRGADFFDSVIFQPKGLRFLSMTWDHGTILETEPQACLTCGTVWSQTNPVTLRDFIRKHCKGSESAALVAEEPSLEHGEYRSAFDSEPIQCPQCDSKIPGGQSKCSGCGWTYQT